MKCKKYDQTWFDNKYIQLLNMNCSKERKLTKLLAFMQLAKEHHIIPKNTKESKVKFVREDYGKQKTKRSLRERIAKLRRKRKERK